jgi:hypothetical protein
MSINYMETCVRPTLITVAGVISSVLIARGGYHLFESPNLVNLLMTTVGYQGIKLSITGDISCNKCLSKDAYLFYACGAVMTGLYCYKQYFA